MRSIVTACLAALFAAAPAAAQQADRAALVTVLGRDTLALERWTRTPTRITAEAVVRSPRTTYRRYVLDLAAGGRMRRYEERVYDPAAPETPVRTEVYDDAGVGWTRTVTMGDSVATSRVEAPDNALPWIDLVHWPFELALMRAAGGQGGGTQPMLAGGRPLAYGVAPAQGGGWTLTHPLRGPSLARVDAEGRLLSLDAAGTTRKVIVTRVPWLELAEPAARWARADREGRGVGELSGRGRDEATVDGAHLLVDYGTPMRRGREIFGQVVPWGQVWRTGANRATHFTTDHTLVLGDDRCCELVVPPGEYTLYSIPEQDGGWLIVNRQTGQGGTTYDAARDLGRVRMTRTTLDEPVEAFTIEVEPAGKRGILRIVWDRTAFTVPFRVDPWAIVAGFGRVMPARSVLGAGTLQAQERGTVTGVVVYAATGAPLPGVRVAIGTGRVGRTDAQGRFVLCRLAPGPAELAARLHGYRGPALELTLSAGEAPPVRLALAADTSGQSGRAAWPEHGDGVSPFGIMLDGKRFIGSSDGCGGTPEVPYFEVTDLDRTSIREVAVYKGAEAAERFRAPVEGLLVITTNPPSAP